MKIQHATKFDSSLSSNLAKRDMGYAKRKKGKIGEKRKERKKRNEKKEKNKEKDSHVLK